MLATILSRAQLGMEAPQVSVEVFLGAGLPLVSIVGLPEAVVRESKDRVRSAIVTAKFEFPVGRITINLAPADIPKEGGRFDLPIALGILVASRQIPSAALAGCEFYGELSLSGELRAVRSVLPAVCGAASAGHRVVLPRPNLEEATLVRRASVAPADHLLEVCAHLRGVASLQFRVGERLATPTCGHPDLADVRGQAHARRALEIAAAGCHHMLLTGPPGTGKSMLAHRLPGIVPPMTEAEALETASVASVSTRGFRVSEWALRPFRAPHHTASGVALVGGGSPPRPGEISLAHNGVLFLDELPEFQRRVLEVLREPMESGSITISRAARQTEFPARFQLIAAMNPCPCGYLGDASGRCRCSAEVVARYHARVSGPLLDRIDLHVDVPRLEAECLGEKRVPSEGSVDVAARVARAREIQALRQGACNAHLGIAGVEKYCRPDTQGRRLLERAVRQLGLSARAYHRVLKVARTIADLHAESTVSPARVGEAVMLRGRGVLG